MRWDALTRAAILWLVPEKSQLQSDYQEVYLKTFCRFRRFKFHNVKK